MLWILNLKGRTLINIPTTSDLSEGEFAVNTYDGKMFMRDGSNNIVTVASHYTTDFDSSTKTFYVTVATSTTVMFIMVVVLVTSIRLMVCSHHSKTYSKNHISV